MTLLINYQLTKILCQNQEKHTKQIKVVSPRVQGLRRRDNMRDKRHKCKYPLCNGKTLKELGGYTLCGYFQMEGRVFMSYKDCKEIYGTKGTC